MPHPAHTLSALGFTESEIKAYFALIEHGTQTAADLAKQSGLSRQTIYEAVETLTVRALVTTVEHDGKRFFRAEHPEKLLSYAKRREEDMRQHVQDLAHELPSIEMQMGGERPVVKTYRGKEGILAIMADARPVFPATIYEMTDADAMFKVLTRDDLKPLQQAVYTDAVKHLIGIVGTKNIEEMHTYWLSRSSTPAVKLRRVYIPPEESDFKSHIEIVGDTVTFVTYTGRMDSVAITHPSIAKAMRLLFKYAFRGLHGMQDEIMKQ